MNTSIRAVIRRNMIPRLTAGLDRRLSAVVAKAAFDLQAHAQTSILAGDKTGAVYGTHQASAPGEAPANDLGILAASIVTAETGPLEQTVTAGAEYAAGLELGTTKIAPRPFMQPAADAIRIPFALAVQQTVEKG